MKESNKIIIASGSVIIEDRRVWLNKDQKDPFWKFPGGKVEEGITVDSFMSLEQACHRETKEENDGDVEIVCPLKPMCVTKPNDPGTWVVLIHWLARRKSEFRVASEIVAVQTFEVEKILRGEYNGEQFAPNIVPVIEHYLDLKRRGILTV
jgi:ADP-ribose pyrophosphatase YjhB (NUDIX family)